MSLVVQAAKARSATAPVIAPTTKLIAARMVDMVGSPSGSHRSTRHWWLLMELNYQQNAPRFRSPRWGIAARVGLIDVHRQLAATAISRGRSQSWLCWPI